MREPFIAGLLSFLIPGIGQIYNGRILIGVLWLIVTGISWIGSAGLLGWVVHLFSAWCAYSYAKDSGQSLEFLNTILLSPGTSSVPGFFFDFSKYCFYSKMYFRCNGRGSGCILCVRCPDPSFLFFMVKDGIPYVILPLVIALVFGYFGLWIVAAFFAALAAFMAFFFRDPHREMPVGEGLIVSAADGRVTRIEDNGETKLVSVFLSPFDVHINRSPITGTISKVDYVRGRKAPATADASSLTNERNSLTIEGTDFTVICTQIAGILARRIVCWKKAGDLVVTGERFGMIKFSSRTDLLIPGRAEILVKTGDRVKGGETVIATLA